MFQLACNSTIRSIAARRDIFRIALRVLGYPAVNETRSLARSEGSAFGIGRSEGTEPGAVTRFDNALHCLNDSCDGPTTVCCR
jgi:hypothetical protein